MYDHWDPEKYRYLIENILITTDLVPYTLSISIFVSPVLKNMCCVIVVKSAVLQVSFVAVTL